MSVYGGEKGAGCNKLYWRLRNSELYRKNTEPLWGTKPSLQGLLVWSWRDHQVSTNIMARHTRPWQDPKIEKKRLSQTENSARPHLILFSGSVITSCFSFHFQYPHIHTLSSCFLLAKTEPAANPIYPQASNTIEFNNVHITRNECMV